MTGNFLFSPNMLALLISIFLGAGLSIYTWQRRFVPGAGPILILLLFQQMWALFKVLELVSNTFQVKLFWFNLSSVCIPFMLVAGFYFVLEYTGGRKLSADPVPLLALLPSMVMALLFLTNNIHHLMWDHIWLEEFVRGSRSSLTWAFFIYYYCLYFVSAYLLLRLFVYLPTFRWSAAILLVVLGAIVAIDFLRATGQLSIQPVDPGILAFNLMGVMYVVGALRLQSFAVISTARDTAIERMEDGVFVMDTQYRIVFQNLVAKKVLDSLDSRQAGLAMSGPPDIVELANRIVIRPLEIVINTGENQNYFITSSAPLIDPRGWQLGHLFMFHDVSEIKRAQEHFAHQQRALAAFEERVRLAQDLHDDLGQVLGYVKMQAQAARELLAREDTYAADQLLTKLISVSQEAHTNIRNYILDATIASSAGPSFLTSLKQYLNWFSETWDMSLHLSLPPGLDEIVLEPAVAGHLLHIVQESLINARKHASASCISLSLSLLDDQIHIVIKDDGQGFDPNEVLQQPGLSFGLGFMRQRAEQIGARFDMQSTLGQGTQVTIQVPYNGESYESSTS